jgi:hypothetical protein
MKKHDESVFLQSTLTSLEVTGQFNVWRTFCTLYCSAQDYSIIDFICSHLHDTPESYLDSHCMGLAIIMANSS